MLKRLLLAALLAFASLTPVSATVYTTPVTVPTTSWTLLGVGPLIVSVPPGSGMWVVVSDTMPTGSTSGHYLTSGMQPTTFNTSSSVWGIAVNSSVVAQVTPELPVAGAVTGSVSLIGSLPAFAATPTFNLGTASTLNVQWSGQSVSQSGTWAVRAAPVNPTPTSVSIGTTSAQAVASATWTYVSIDNPGTATIACSFGGTAILNTPPSYSIPPGYTRVWVPGTAPSGAINCISSAATTATIASY